MSQLHCVVHLRVALGCVFFLCFARQGCAGLHVHCFLQLRAQVLRALYCTFQCSRNEAFNVAVTSCFGSHSCAGLRILFCALQFRVAAMVCVICLRFASQGCAGLRIISVLQFRVALVWVFLWCFASQGCSGLRIPIALCNSGLRWSPYSHFLFAIQGCAGLRFLFVLCISGLRWSAFSYCVLQVWVALVCVALCSTE